jgi:hypothetical protein
MVIFGKWPLWIVIGIFTFVTAVAMAAAGNILLAAVLAAVVVGGGYYSLRGGTNY